MLVMKYRPKTFNQIVGRDSIIKSLKEHIASPEGLPHLLFSGNAGGGKTLMAEVLANEIFKSDRVDMFYEFNASNDRGIEMVRGQLVEIAKKRPMCFPYKVILLDESDYMTADAQAAMRRLLEQYGQITRFILSCNYRHKLIPPIVSRCVEYQFTPFEPELVAKYLKAIVQKENMTKSDRELIAISQKCNGDLRKALNMLEGNTETSDVSEFWEKLSLEDFKKFTKDGRIELSFKTDDAEMIFNGIWEFVKRNKAYKWIPLMADCQSKMNFSMQKNIFVTDLLAKME